MRNLVIIFSWQFMAMFSFVMISHGETKNTCKPDQQNDVSQYFFLKYLGRFKKIMSYENIVLFFEKSKN